MHRNGLGVKKTHYSVQFKLDMIQEYEVLKESQPKLSKLKFAESRNVSHQTFSKWLAAKDKLINCENTALKKIHPGRKKNNQEYDNYASDWTKNKIDKGLKVTPRNFAFSLKSKFPGTLGGTSIRKVRRKVYRIFNNIGLVNRRVTAKSNALTELDLANHRIDFANSFNENIVLYSVPTALQINMDETNIQFDPDTKTSFAPKGAKVVVVSKPTTTECCTAMLAVSVSGAKLPPMVVFKGAEKGGYIRKEFPSYDRRNKYEVTPTSFVNERVMLEWISQCLVPYVKENGGGPNSGMKYFILGQIAIVTFLLRSPNTN